MILLSVGGVFVGLRPADKKSRLMLTEGSDQVDPNDPWPPTPTFCCCPTACWDVMPPKLCNISQIFYTLINTIYLCRSYTSKIHWTRKKNQSKNYFWYRKNKTRIMTYSKMFTRNQKLKLQLKAVNWILRLYIYWKLEQRAFSKCALTYIFD